MSIQRERYGHGGSKVPLQGQVTPEHRRAITEAAKKSRISRNLYMDALIGWLEENGGLPELSAHQETLEGTLPLSASA
ncbi:hypothetical protein ACFUOZ_20095 [Paenarthrobacter sp. NPDC057355]|uniref:hypothetical protein n=1 Tax=Paenarthrobacter sp. NPDC057355 TaxID=3346105 RepID=UPI003645AA75